MNERDCCLVGTKIRRFCALAHMITVARKSELVSLLTQHAARTDDVGRRVAEWKQLFLDTAVPPRVDSASCDLETSGIGNYDSS